MNKLQKLILPALVVAVIALLYFGYFAPSDELGDFSTFDKNSNASVSIAVKFVKDKGLQRDSEGGTTFYVVDKKNKEVKVLTSATIPPGMDMAKSLVLNGHLTSDHFHAHGIEMRN